MQGSISKQALSTVEHILNFTRCERPNGTVYGTSGRCRLGVEAPLELPDRVLNLLQQKVTSLERLIHKDESTLKVLADSPRGREVREELEKKIKNRQTAINKIRKILEKTSSDPSPKPEKEISEQGGYEERLKDIVKQQKAAKKKLTKSEKEAILAYTSDDMESSTSYTVINDCLRRKKKCGKESMWVIEGLDSALGKLPSNPNGYPFYRGIPISKDSRGSGSLYKRLSKSKVGDTVEDPGYGSFSLNKKEAEGFGGEDKSVLIVSRSKKLVPINSFSSMFDDEGEALLPRGTNLTITAIRRDGNTLILETD